MTLEQRMEISEGLTPTWREAALSWLQHTFVRRDIARRKMTVEELNRDELIAAMKRCGIRVVMWSRPDPRDDYEWHGPGWFIGTNTRGDGVGFYICDEDVTTTIVALMKLKRGAYDDAVKVLEAVCAERKAEKKE